MAEQVFRQPLRVLPIVRPDTNVTMLVTQSPTANNKRTHECLETDTKAIKQGTVTPTKASATPLATNSRKSVKRVKAEVNLKGDTDVVAARLRVNAEADFAAKMKVWIASYKREFPSLRFYFDACSDEDVRRCTRKIVSLGGVDTGLNISWVALTCLVRGALFQYQGQYCGNHKRGSEASCRARKYRP